MMFLNRAKSHKSVAARMTSGDDMEKTTVTIRLTNSEIREIQGVMDDLGKVTSKANRSNLLRACFQLLKEARQERLVEAIKNLP